MPAEGKAVAVLLFANLEILCNRIMFAQRPEIVGIAKMRKKYFR